MGGFKSDSLLDLSCGGFLFNLFLIFSSKNAIYFAQEVNWQDVIDTSNNICQNNAPNYTTRSPRAQYCMYISSIVVEYVYRIGFPPFYQNMTSKSPKCPWSSSKKRKKKVSTTKVMETERKTSLASSDKGSYYQAWTSDEKFNNLVEGASRRKIVEKLDGSLFCDKDLQNSAADDSDSDLEESDSGTQPTESLNIVDGDLLRDAIKEAAICRECKVGELQLKEDDAANGVFSANGSTAKRINAGRGFTSQQRTHGSTVSIALSFWHSARSVGDIPPLRSFSAFSTCRRVCQENPGLGIPKPSRKQPKPC